MHGGVKKEDLAIENLDALALGIKNLEKHVDNIQNVFGLNCVVAINKFTSDTEAEVELVKETLKKKVKYVEPVNVWGEGEKGAINLAESVAKVVEEKEMAGKRIVVGNLMGKDIVVGVAGIGKVNVALTTQLIIDNYKPSCVVNFGLAGGKGKNNFKVGDIVLVEKACQYDFDLSAIDDCPIAYNQNYNDVFINLDVLDNELEKVSLATSDKFTHQKEQIEIINSLGASIYDMEGSSIAQVCKSNNIPLYMIKGVTDVYGSGLQGEQFINNLNQVGKLLSEKVIKLINIL